MKEVFIRPHNLEMGELKAKWYFEARTLIRFFYYSSNKKLLHQEMQIDILVTYTKEIGDYYEIKNNWFRWLCQYSQTFMSM